MDQTDAVRDFYDREASVYVRERYITPSCEQMSYLSRKHIVLDMLRGETGVLLDVGCGPAALTADLLSMGFQVVGTDLSREMLRAARRQVGSGGPPVSFTQGEMTQLPFHSNTFGSVTCIGVLGYTLDIQRALAELHRVLIHRGAAVVQISNRACPSAKLHDLLRRWKRFLTTGDVDTYGFKLTAYRFGEFRRLVGAAGFVVEGSAYYDFRPPLMESLWSDPAMRLTRSLQRLQRSRWLGWLGAGLIVKARKT